MIEPEQVLLLRRQQLRAKHPRTGPCPGEGAEEAAEEATGAVEHCHLQLRA